MQPTLSRGEFAEIIWFDKECALGAADAWAVRLMNMKSVLLIFALSSMLAPDVSAGSQVLKYKHYWFEDGHMEEYVNSPNIDPRPFATRTNELIADDPNNALHQIIVDLYDQSGGGKFATVRGRGTGFYILDCGTPLRIATVNPVGASRLSVEISTLGDYRFIELADIVDGFKASLNELIEDKKRRGYFVTRMPRQPN